MRRQSSSQPVGMAEQASRATIRLYVRPRNRGSFDDLGGDGSQRAVEARRRTDAIALTADHGSHPGQQVSEIVGQVAVVAVDHALV